jgi:beta-lactamase class A
LDLLLSRHVLIVSTVLVLGFGGAPSLALARNEGPRYDVSYIWASRLAPVVRYRDRVRQVLGRGVEHKLVVVRARRLYGLIYDRDGDAHSTQRAAETHTRLLRAAGLDPAAVMLSRPWPVVESRPEAPPEPPATRRNPAAPVPAGGDLDRQVRAYIRAQRQAGRLTPDERTAWSVHDLNAGERLVAINEDLRLQAASMIKPFVALAFLHRARDGRLAYGPKSRRMLERMIQRSDNYATNWVLRALGGPRAVDHLLRKEYGHVLQETRIVEYIPPGGRTYRNTASVNDYDRFLAALWRAALPGTRELKRLMALPNRDRLSTADLPKGTRVYDKTGSTRYVCGDMGILDVPGLDGARRTYTMIGVIERTGAAPDYGRWVKDRGNVIREVSELVHRALYGRHLQDDGQLAAMPRLARPPEASET